MVTLSSADGALKSFYLDAVTDALNMKINPFLAEIEKTSQNITGKDVRKAFTPGYSNGIAPGAEDGNLPESKQREYKQMVAPLKNFYGTLEITDKAIRATANNEGTFVNLLNEEMQALLDSAKFNFGRMLFGDGTGSLSTITAYTSGWLTVSNVKNFAVGMVLDIWLGETKVDNVTITKIDYDANKVYTESAHDTATMQSMVGGRFHLQGSKGGELTGLEAIFSTKAIYGLSRDIVGMTPYTAKSVGEITEAVVEGAMDRVEAESGKRPNFIICSWEVRRALQNYYKTCGIALPTIKMEGGYTALDFNGVPVVADRFCPKDTMYLLNTDYFKLYQLCDWQWLESEDGKILKQVAGKPVYTATLVKYAELICENPSAQAKLSGITIA